ncbi:MAG: hypothetical protein U0793_02610 [Gemmataceae bacterium]
MKTQVTNFEQLDSVTEEIGEAVVLRLLGRATAGTLDYLEELLRNILSGRPAKVVIEGSELAELASVAVSALMRFGREIARFGGETRMISLPL